MSDAETARVITFVAVTPEAAFEVFTCDIDLWWSRGRRFRGATAEGESQLRFERDADGHRLIEQCGTEVFELGRVRVWEPGKRLVMDFRLRNFAQDECTELEIRFDAFGEGTRVTLEHRGWERIRRGHPARHELSGQAFGSMMGLWWADVLTGYRTHMRSGR
jgi:hypothetical protein